eukprot:6466927-Amphidinium_carterae.1
MVCKEHAPHDHSRERSNLRLSEDNLFLPECIALALANASLGALPQESGCNPAAGGSVLRAKVLLRGRAGTPGAFR